MQLYERKISLAIFAYYGLTLLYIVAFCIASLYNMPQIISAIVLAVIFVYIGSLVRPLFKKRGDIVIADDFLIIFGTEIPASSILSVKSRKIGYFYNNFVNYGYVVVASPLRPNSEAIYIRSKTGYDDKTFAFSPMSYKRSAELMENLKLFLEAHDLELVELPRGARLD